MNEYIQYETHTNPNRSSIESDSTALLDVPGVQNTQIPNFIKIRPVGAELFYAGGRTDGQT